jgi:hypothetical protein
MSVLDIQRRGQQIGRIRIGQLVKMDDGRSRPAKLDTFRFTTGSKVAADAIADLFGGEVRPWAEKRGQFEVITREFAIGVMVPPRDQVVSQHYEMWTAGGCQRRCDSQHEQISNGPCLCPHAEDTTNADEVSNMASRRAELAKLNPPQACKLSTRINVMIPDLPGLGVFRIDTHSYYAAVEIGDAAALMQMARDQGVMLPAVLRIDQRQRVAGGQTKNYPVLVLEVLTTFRALASGELKSGGSAAQLPPAPGAERRALTTGRPAVQQSPAVATATATVQEQPPPTGDPDAPEDGRGPAQQIADLAAIATTRAAVGALQHRAKTEHCGGDLICVDRANEVYEDLLPYLRTRWRQLPRPDSR